MDQYNVFVIDKMRKGDLFKIKKKTKNHCFIPKIIVQSQKAHSG